MQPLDKGPLAGAKACSSHSDTSWLACCMVLAQGLGEPCREMARNLAVRSLYFRQAQTISWLGPGPDGKILGSGTSIKHSWALLKHHVPLEGGEASHCSLVFAQRPKDPRDICSIWLTVCDDVGGAELAQAGYKSQGMGKEKVQISKKESVNVFQKLKAPKSGPCVLLHSR